MRVPEALMGAAAARRGHLIEMTASGVIQQRATAGAGKRDRGRQARARASRVQGRLGPLEAGRTSRWLSGRRGGRIRPSPRRMNQRSANAVKGAARAHSRSRIAPGEGTTPTRIAWLLDA
jgi:hypothetical protein